MACVNSTCFKKAGAKCQTVGDCGPGNVLECQQACTGDPKMACDLNEQCEMANKGTCAGGASYCLPPD
jgi:hypothetical protein